MFTSIPLKILSDFIRRWWRQATSVQTDLQDQCDQQSGAREKHRAILGRRWLLGQRLSSKDGVCVHLKTNPKGQHSNIF